MIKEPEVVSFHDKTGNSRTGSGSKPEISVFSGCIMKTDNFRFFDHIYHSFFVPLTCKNLYINTKEPGLFRGVFSEE